MARGAAGWWSRGSSASEGSNPFDLVDWELRTAEIKDERGRAIFQQTRLRGPA